MSTVTLGGNPVNVAGNFPKAGDAAPDFTLTGKDLKDVSLKDYAGKHKVLNIVPSLDTPRMPDLDAQIQRESRQPRQHRRARDIR